MTYQEALLTALSNKELITEYDRLTNSHLTQVLKSVKNGGINLEIDKCTGFLKAEIEKFREFFDEYIWATFINEMLKAELKERGILK